MNRDMVETYRYLRDHAKPCSERDAADLTKVRAPQPPSRALLGRIKRHRENRPFMEPVVEPKPVSDETLALRRQLDFHKRVIASLGGSQWIEPTPLARPRPAPIQVIDGARNSPFPANKMDRLESERRALLARSIETSSRLKYRDYQPDMFEVLDAFGNFPNFEEAVK